MRNKYNMVFLDKIRFLNINFTIVDSRNSWDSSGDSTNAKGLRRQRWCHRKYCVHRRITSRVSTSGVFCHEACRG